MKKKNQKQAKKEENNLKILLFKKSVNLGRNAHDLDPDPFFHSNKWILSTGCILLN